MNGPTKLGVESRSARLKSGGREGEKSSGGGEIFFQRIVVSLYEEAALLCSVAAGGESRIDYQHPYL